jgi:hypothetical protein
VLTALVAAALAVVSPSLGERAGGRGRPRRLRGGAHLPGLRPRLRLAAATPWPLPARARLEDLQGRLAAYSVGSTLHLLRLDTGNELTLRLAALVHAQIDPGRLYLSSDRLVREGPLPAVS